jgi:hypothetical protein
VSDADCSGGYFCVDAQCRNSAGGDDAGTSGNHDGGTSGYRDGGTPMRDSATGPENMHDAAAPQMLCTPGGANDEPEILVGFAPATGGHVAANGQIKVWVNDECPPAIAPGEQVDPATGMITTIGDRMAVAADGYLWEPALYIAPATAEHGGQPHFPTRILGTFADGPTSHSGCASRALNSMGIEPVPPGTSASSMFTAEFVWDVSSLGLAPGSYEAEFVIHDGDRDRGVGCIPFTID